MPDTRPYFVSAALDTAANHKTYRRAGLILTAAPARHDLTAGQLAALRADTKVSVIEAGEFSAAPSDAAAMELKSKLAAAQDAVAQHELDREQMTAALAESERKLAEASKANADAAKRIAELETSAAMNGQAAQAALARAESAERDLSEAKARLLKYESGATPAPAPAADATAEGDKKKSGRRI